MQHMRIAVLALAVLLTGCVPAALRSSPPPTDTAAEHRLDEAFETYPEWVENGVALDTYSCHTPKAFNEDSFHHARATYLHAMMANNTYGNPPDKPFFQIPGWSLVRRYETRNGFGAHLYLSDDRSQGVVAYRGTDFTSPVDWFGANFTFHPIPPQYVEAQRTLDAVQQEFPDTRFSVAGHSLGGGLALTVSQNTDGMAAYVYNSSPRVTAWRGAFENETFVTTERGEALRLFSRPIVWFGLPHARNRKFDFAKANPRFGLATGAGINHGIYTLARSLLLLAAQDMKNGDGSIRLPGLDHARASFAANIDRDAALALNPVLCNSFFPNAPSESSARR